MTLPGIISNLLDVCQKHNATCFAWGNFALAMLNNYCPDKKENFAFLDHYDFFVAAESEQKILSVLEEFSIRLSSAHITCSVERSANIPVRCILNLPGAMKREIHVHGPGIIQGPVKELHMTNDKLLRKHAFKLSRFFPVAYTRYYDLLVPVPNDPVFVFSHIVPFKNDRITNTYTFGQGCEKLTINCSFEIPGLTNFLTGNGNMEKVRAVTFNDLCVNSPVLDVFPSLETILKANNQDAILRFEDCENIVPLERGDGNYRLTDNNKRRGWSQYGQEDFVTKYFKNKTNGFFVEVGGFDGESFSNTLYLERELHWDGILIEAIPPLYKRLKSKHRKCFILNSCISDTVQVQNFVHAGALSSSDIAMTDKHKNRIQNEHAQLVPQKYRIYCKSFLRILDATGTRKIDFFSLDVEGGELIILNSIDFTNLDIELFTIETDQHRDEIIKFMESKGYTRIHKLSGDDLFQKKRS